MIRRIVFDLRYRLGHAPWDTGISPPELLALLNELPAGRALDLGCGTGTNAATMAQRGWQVVGVDFSPQALSRARRRLRGLSPAPQFVLGEVTRLEGVAGPFDLALDIGCYHALSADGQARYVQAIASRLPAGSAFLLYAILRGPDRSTEARPTRDELTAAFRPHFVLRSSEDGRDRGRPSIWMHWQRLG
jgi:cyclopropane fatty-acyl-phospholipid synthase-like methyltransferase